MATYRGKRLEPLNVEVTVDGQPLPPRNDLKNHSPDGFEWGYGGSGPAQLALALLAHHFGQDGSGRVADKKALALYQAFKAKLVAGLPKEGWTLEAHVIDDTVAMVVAEHASSSFERMIQLEVFYEALEEEYSAALDRLEVLEDPAE